MSRKSKGRVGLIATCAIIASCVYAIQKSAYVQTQYAVWRFKNATTEEDRTHSAEKLAALGKSGLEHLITFLDSDNEFIREATTNSIVRLIQALPDDDQRYDLILAKIADDLDSPNRARDLYLQLVPTLLKKSGDKYSDICRRVVVAGLASKECSIRIISTQLALHPNIRIESALIPLLKDPEASVRQAALFAIASADYESLLSDEQLFQWLHDTDESVRNVCRDALISRGRSEFEIALGSRLTHPNPIERLRLLLDLRYDEVADPEPWLERLSHDAEPAIRAGAARVVIEVSKARSSSVPLWISRVAGNDENPTVRRVATFYLSQMANNQLNLVQPVSGP